MIALGMSILSLGCAEQGRMHGGDLRSTLPDSEGGVTLIRLRLAGSGWTGTRTALT